MSAVEEVSHQNGANQISDVVVRFAGDSGDGMQLTGSNFTEATAIYGNDLATFPDFPAEIRAPVGATFGVSAFQIYFGAEDVTTAGDALDVLVAMNPAALKANIDDLPEGGMLVVNIDSFKSMNLKKAGYESNPLDDDEFRKKFSGSPIKRIGRNRFVRNVLYAIGNSKSKKLAQYASKLTNDTDYAVSDAAKWALENINVDS